MASDGPYPSPAASVRTFPSHPHDHRHDRHDHQLPNAYQPSPIGPSLSLPRPSPSSSTYPTSLRPSLLIPRRTCLAPALSTPSTSLDVRPIHVSSIQPTLFNVNPSRLGQGRNPFDLLTEHKFDRFVENVTETIKNVLRRPDAVGPETTKTMTGRRRDVFGAVERIGQQGIPGNDDAEQDDQRGVASPPLTENRPLFLHETSEEYETSSEAPRHSFDPILGEQDRAQPRQNGETEVIELGSSSDEQDEDEEEEEEEQDGSYDEDSVDDARSGSGQVAEDEWMNEAPRQSQFERHLGSEGSSRSIQRGREADLEEEDEEDGEEDDDKEEDEEDGEEDEEEEEDGDDEEDEEEEARDELRDDEMEQHVQEQDQEEDEEELLDPQTAFALSMQQITRVDAQGDEVDTFVEILEEEFEVNAVDDDGKVFQPVDDEDEDVEDEQVDDDEEGTPPLPPSMAEAFRNARSGEVWDPVIKGPSLLVQEPEYNDDDAEDEEVLGSRIPAHLKGKGRAPTPSTQSPASADSIFDSEGGNGSLEPEDDGEDYDDEEDDDLDSLVNFQAEDLPDMTFERLTKLMKTLQEMYDSACRQQDEETVRWVEDKWEVVKEAWIEKGGELSSDDEGEEGEDDDEEVDGGHFDQEDDESEQVENEDDGSAAQDRIENLALQMLERYAQGQDQEVRVDVKVETQRIVQEMIDEEDGGQEGSGLAQAYQDESGPDEGVDEDVDTEETEDHEMAFTGHQYRPPTPDEDDTVPAQSTMFDDEAVMGVPTFGETESTEGNWLAILQDQIQAQAAADAEATAVDEQAALGFAPPLSAEVGRFSADDRMEEDGDVELEEEEEEDDDVQILSPVDLMSSSPTPSHEEQGEDAIPQKPPTLPREETAPLMGNDEPATPGSEQSVELGQDAQFVVLEEESTDGGIAEASNEIAPSEVPQDEKSTPATPRIRNVIELGEWDPSSPIRFDTTLPSPSTQPSEVASSSDVHAEPQLSHVGMDAALRAALALPAATLEEQFGGVAAESAAASTLEPPSAHVASPEAEASNDASQQHFSGLGNIWAQLRAEAPRASMETTLPVQPAQETAQNLSPETQPTSEQTITTDAALTAIDVTMPPSSASLDALLDYVQVSDVVPTDLDTSLDVTPGISLQAAHVEAGLSTTVEVSPSTPEAGPSDSTASVVRANPPSSVTTGGVQGPTGLLTPDPDGYDRVPSHEDEEGEIEGEEEMQRQEDPFVEAPPGFKVVEEREQTLEVTEAPYESIESVAAEIHTELEHAPETARESSIIDEQDLAYFKARHHSEHLVIVDDDESIPTMSANVSIISDDEEDEIEVEVDIEVDETIGDPESIDIDRAFEEIVASSPLKQSLPSDLDLDIGYRTQEDEFAGQTLVRAEEEAEPALPTSEVPSMPAGEDEIPQDKSLADEAPSDEHLAEQPAAIKESSDHEAETPAPDEPGKLESLSFDAEEFEDYTLTEAFFPDAPDVIEAEEGVKDLLETGGPLRSTTPDYEPFTTTPEAEPFEYDGVEEGAEFSWDGEGDLELSEEEVGPEVINGLDEEHDFDLDAPLPTVEDPWTPEAEAHIDEAASSSDSEADEAVEGMLLSEADCVVKPEEQHVMEEEDELHSVAATVDDAESVHVHFASPIVPQEEETDAFIESASQDEPAHVEAEAVQMDDRAAVETSPASPKPSAETEEYSAATTKRHQSTRSKSPAKRARTSTPETDTTQSPRRISARLHPEALLPPIDISVPIPTLDQTPRLVTPDPTSQGPAVELTRRRSERNLRRSASVVTLRDPSPLPAVAAVEASAAPETDPSTPSSVRRSTRHTTPGSRATSKKRSRSDAEPEPKSEERGVSTSTSVTKSPAGGPKRRRGTPAPVAVEAPATTPHPIAPRLHHHPSSSTVQRDEETMVDHPTTRAHCPFVQLEVQSREYPSAPPVVVNIPSCALSTPLAQETLRTFPIRQIDQLPPHPTLDDSVLRLGGQGHTTSTSHDPPESGSTHLSIEERDAELIRYPDVLDALKKLAGGDLWHEGVMELVSGGGRRSLRGRSMDVEGAGGAEVGEVAMEKEEVASDRESKGASSGSATTTTRSLRKRK